MRRVPFVIAALALAASITPARAVPPVLAGALASDNVDFLLNLPDVPAIGARIVTVTDGLFPGTYLYVTTSQGLRIYDVTLGIPVPAGALQLPHVENENVDTNGKILLISADHAFGQPNMLYVIDVSNPHAPLLTGVLPFGRSGHTVTCIQDCTYAFVSSPGFTVVDLRNPTSPKELARLSTPRGGVHNFWVDAAGIAWASASDGLVAYDVRPEVYDPSTGKAPPLVADQGGGPPPGFHDDFIIHNSLRPNAMLPTPQQLADSKIDPGEIVYVTEENWIAVSNGLCDDDGQFQTGWLHTVAGKPVIERIGAFKIGQGQLTQGKKPLGAVACSSHWFDWHDNVIADAWYEQGLRFLDVSDPRNIRQIGYFMPAVTENWMALYREVSSGPTAGLYVYTFDVARGIDVLLFTGKAGDKPQLAPRWNSSGVTFSKPSPQWGYACRLLV